MTQYWLRQITTAPMRPTTVIAVILHRTRRMGKGAGRRPRPRWDAGCTRPRAWSSTPCFLQRLVNFLVLSVPIMYESCRVFFFNYYYYCFCLVPLPLTGCALLDVVRIRPFWPRSHWSCRVWSHWWTRSTTGTSPSLTWWRRPKASAAESSVR